MIIQSPLHKPSRVFTIHSFSNTYLSLSLSAYPPVYLSFPSDQQFHLAILKHRDINRFYQPFSQRFQTRLTPRTPFENSLPIQNCTCVYICIYIYTSINLLFLFLFEAEERIAGRHVRTKRTPISLSLGSQ